MIVHVAAGTLLACLLVCADSARAQAGSSDPIRDAYMRFYAGDLAGAQQQFDHLHAARQQDLRAWLGSLLVLQSRIADDELLAPAFERGIDAFLAHADQRYSRSRADTEALFHLAQGHFLRGAYRFEHDKGMWGAARDAAKSKGFADEYLKRHPEHGDAYLVLGLYNYYVDIAPNFVKVLRVLLFLPSGNRAAGLQQIERAGRDGDLFAPLAQSALADVYGSLEGRLADAIPIAERLAQRFPGNADMRFSLAAMYMHPTVEAFDLAAQQYSAVLDHHSGRSQHDLNARHRATLGLANLRRTEWRLEDAIALLTPTIDQKIEKPDWVLPTFLLRRANYRMLLNDPGAADDARRVRGDARMADWRESADQHLAAIAGRARSNEGVIYASLIPGNRLVAEDRWEEAKAVYERVAAAAPGDFQVRYRLAYLDFARGNYQAAAAALSSMVAPGARVPSWLKAGALLTLAWTHDIAGRRAEAMTLYKRIVDDFENESAASSARLGLIAPYRGPIRR